MIEPKELISESVLFSISWKHENTQYYVYLTKAKLYEYRYDEETHHYCYGIYLVKNFGHIYCSALSQWPSNYGGKPHCFLNVDNFSDNSRSYARFEFPCSNEGAKTAEKLYIALSKVME